MTYWAVLSAYLDDGRVTATVVGTREADQKPQAGYRETRNADLYTDWFDNYQNALDFVKEAREC